MEADDLLTLTSSPPQAVAILDGGVQTKAFNGALTVEFLNIAQGTHTVEVSVAAGYLPDEDPDHPNQATNLNSSYGNPHKVQITTNAWHDTDFGFGPMFKASAVVRDAWTMERVANAKVEFIAKSGYISNEVFNGYPNYATYKSNWFTAVEGALPTNVLLPTVRWDLRITNSGYRVLYVTNAVQNCNPGEIRNMGSFYMFPIDSNSNQISDVWEVRHFGAVCVDPMADADEDGLFNREEYIAGTDPTNPASFLWIEDYAVSPTSGCIQVAWPVQKWRTYSLEASDYLSTSTIWWRVTDTWEVTNDQTTIQWEDPYSNFYMYCYSVKVVPWDYVGSTQKILHEYPDWSGNYEGPPYTNELPPSP